MSEHGPRLLGGRYEIGDLIGRGGMAEVHVGHDTRLGRTVAIKILRSDLARDPSFLTRFRREAQSAAGLNHPAIVAVYDSGDEESVEPSGGVLHLPYIVMEYVDGQTLRDVLNTQGPLSPDEAARITAGLLSALEYAHAQGIVHRDVKPGNLMMTSSGAVKLSDFGIARALADSAATMTQTSAVVGTARYLSPEQGQGEQVDERSDLYSTGCVLYELLTGRTPFVGDPVSLVYQHLGEPPQPPSVHNPGLSPAYDAVVLHALAKGRDERYQTAGEFREDVLAARSGRPISAAALATAATYTSDGEPTAVLPAGRPSRPREMVAMGSGMAVEHRDVTAEIPLREEEERSQAWIWLLALTALLLVGGLLWWFLWGPGKGDATPTSPTSTITTPAMKAVPDVVGQTQERATQILTDAGFKTTVTPKVDATVESGLVMSTDPKPNDMAAEGSTITLVVSQGPGQGTVPDVSGKTQEEATKLLTDAGFKTAVADEPAHTPEFTEGQVASQDPAPNTPQDKGLTVTITLASGKVPMPKVTEMREVQASQTLANNKLDYTAELVTTDEFAPGTVIRQEPKPEELVEQGTKVKLWIAQAPVATITQTQTATVSVPPSSPDPTGPTATTPTGSVTVSNITVRPDQRTGTTEYTFTVRNTSADVNLTTVAIQPSWPAPDTAVGDAPTSYPVLCVGSDEEPGPLETGKQVRCTLVAPTESATEPGSRVVVSFVPEGDAIAPPDVVFPTGR